MPQPEDIWRKETFAGVIFASAVISVQFMSLYGIVTGATFFVFSALSASVWASHIMHASWQDSLSAQSFAYLWACVLPIAFLPRSGAAKAFNALVLVTITTSGVLIGRALTGPLVYSFMNNSAADASILAALFPLLAFGRFEWLERLTNTLTKSILVGLPIVAIACTGSSTGIVALFVSGIAWYFASAWRDKRKRKKGLTIVAGISIAALVCGFFMKEDLLNDNGRFRVWGITLRFFYDPVTPCVKAAKTIPQIQSCQKAYINPFTGAGSGSFLLLGPQSQAYAGSDGRVLFIFPHNEFISVFFEQGYIGIFFFLLFGAFTLRKSFDRPWLFSALCTYGFTMLTQFPLRFFGSALIGAILAREALEKRFDYD